MPSAPEYTESTLLHRQHLPARPEGAGEGGRRVGCNTRRPQADDPLSLPSPALGGGPRVREVCTWVVEYVGDGRGKCDGCPAVVGAFASPQLPILRNLFSLSPG